MQILRGQTQDRSSINPEHTRDPLVLGLFWKRIASEHMEVALGEEVDPLPEDGAGMPIAATRPLRENVTQVQYHRWLIAEEHKKMGDAERGNNDDFKKAHEAQIERHVQRAQANKQLALEQLESTRQSVDSLKTRKHETADLLRLQLDGLRGERAEAIRKKHDHARQLVEHDKLVLAQAVRDRQNSARKKKEKGGAQTRRESAAREAERQRMLDDHAARLRAATLERFERERVATKPSREWVQRANKTAAERTRFAEKQWRQQRGASTERFLESQGKRRDATYSQRESQGKGREALMSARQRDAAAMRSASRERQQEKRLSKERVASQAQKQHDLMYTSKFAAPEVAAAVRCTSPHLAAPRRTSPHLAAPRSLTQPFVSPHYPSPSPATPCATLQHPLPQTPTTRHHSSSLVITRHHSSLVTLARYLT